MVTWTALGSSRSPAWRLARSEPIILADLGADVLRVDRAEACGPDATPPADPLSRSRRSVGINLKDADGIGLLLDLAETAHVLVEEFRPGVAEGWLPRWRSARRGTGGWCTVDYRLGPGWPAGQYRRARYRLHRCLGALYLIGRVGERPVPPINLLVISAAAACCFGPLALVERDGWGSAWPGRRRRHGGRVGTADRVPLRAAGRGAVAGPARGQPAGRRSAWFDDTSATAGGRPRWLVGALEPKSRPGCRWPDWALPRTFPPRTTSPAGRRSGSGSPRRSRSGAGTTGARRRRGGFLDSPRRGTGAGIWRRGHHLRGPRGSSTSAACASLHAPRFGEHRLAAEAAATALRGLNRQEVAGLWPRAGRRSPISVPGA